MSKVFIYMINIDRKKRLVRKYKFFLLSSSSKSSIEQECYFDIYYLLRDFIKGRILKKGVDLEKKVDLENFSELFIFVLMNK